MNQKLIIYQLLPRLFGNPTTHPQRNGSLEQNGSGRFSSIRDKALQEIVRLGCNYVWYTGVIEHATKSDFTACGIERDHPAVIKGEAGSPYAIKDYYDVNPYLADRVENRMAEFEQLVERTHRNGLRVVLDFVPNHVARQYRSDAKPEGVSDFGASDESSHAFDAQNNYYYLPNQPLAGALFADADAEEVSYREYPARATGNDCFHAYPTANDWYETVKLNYGVDYMGGGAKQFEPIPDTWLKMEAILRFWAAKGVDAFRCDMAEMVPVEFWGWVIPQLKSAFPDLLFIAEVYNPSLYRSYLYAGKFDYLYDKVGLYDRLKQVIRGEAPASAITACWQQLEGISNQMLNFLENHDEQRIASPFFAGSAEVALPALVVSAALGRSPFMLYFGQELGEAALESEGFSGVDGRTTIFDYWRVESIERWYNGGVCDGLLLTERQRTLRGYYQKLLTICRDRASIVDGQFFDLMYVNPASDNFNPNTHYAFLRYSAGELLVVVVNFSCSRAECALVLPQHAFDYFGILPKARALGVELLSGESNVFALHPETPLSLTLPPYGAVMWSFSV